MSTLREQQNATVHDYVRAAATGITQETRPLPYYGRGNFGLDRTRRMATLSEEAEMAKHARWPMWLGVSYAALVGTALVFALQPGGEGLRGVWAVLLALPWSALSVFLFDAINPRFTDQF